jgi:hypothetical protein
MASGAESLRIRPLRYDGLSWGEACKGNVMPVAATWGLMAFGVALTFMLGVLFGFF